MAILNSRNSATIVSLNDLIHIVDVDDPTDNPLGTSKKASIQQIRDLISSYTDTFLELTDTPASFSSQNGKGVRVNAGATALEFYDIIVGASTYLDLTDTPNAYTGDNNKFIRVNAGATGLEHVAASAINVSAFNNDAGYLTSFTETDPIFTASPAANVVNNLSNTVFLSGDGTYQSAGADGNGIYTGSGTIPTTTLSAVTDTAYFTGQTNSTILSLTKNTAIGGTGGFVGINTNGGNGNLEINAPTVGGKNYNFYSNAGGGSVFVHREQGAGIQGGGFSIGSGSQNVASLFVSDDAALGTVVRIDSLASGNEIYLPRTEGFVRFNKGINVGNTAAPQAGTVATFRGNTFVQGDLRIDTTTTSGASVDGQVWTATDNLGNGNWETPAGGADGNGIYSSSSFIGADRTVTLTDGVSVNHKIDFRNTGNSILFELNAVSDSFSLGLSANAEADSRAVTIGESSSTFTGAGSLSIAIGNIAVANSGGTSSAIAIGKSAKSLGGFGISIGQSAGEDATTQGLDNILIGQDAAFGVATIGTQNIFIGRRATGAAAQGGIALGSESVANGNFSSALGFRTQANGLSSIALGDRVLATATESYIIGSGGATTATNSIASSLAVAFGANIPFRFAESTDSYLNGSGNVGIGTSTPTAKLHVVGTGTVALIGGDTRINGDLDLNGDAYIDASVIITGTGGTANFRNVAKGTTEYAIRQDTLGFTTINSGANRGIYFALNSVNDSVIDNTNNWGIGDLAPLANNKVTIKGGSISANHVALRVKNSANTTSLIVKNNGNVGIGLDDYGSGVGVVALGNATAPSVAPTGGGVIYVEGGALKYRGSSGTVTTIANA